MTNFAPHSPNNFDTTPRNKFPILAQLGILSLILFGLFSTLLLKSDSTNPKQTLPTQNISTDNKQYPITPQKIEEISLRAKAAYVWDIKGQRALYSKNENEVLPLASITKLMTALLAHELISEHQKTEISLSAILQEGSSGLSVGEQMEIEDLLQLALISSSNDAAYALSASVGSLLGDQDPASQFVTGMNIRAGELGLNTLKFRNPTGLDLSDTETGGVGSAKDVSFLMEYIIQNYPEILAPTQQANALVYNTAGAYHEANNTNYIVDKIPNLIGSKTGYTDLAGGNLTVAFDAGFDRPVIVTVLGSTQAERFTDVLRLIEAVQNSLSE